MTMLAPNSAQYLSLSIGPLFERVVATSAIACSGESTLSYLFEVIMVVCGFLGFFVNIFQSNHSCYMLASQCFMIFNFFKLT
ncbi:hypothetical protein Sjap_005754 [Stephania japonica]|uniref:Uncharacterized protein n=1 Tax=Stephania japonica TaxID=461633 RepID=A0AAP0K4U9_9MAGN